jgi:chromosome segregation ATPase
MNRLITSLLAFALLFSLSVQAQVTNERKAMSEGVYEAFVLQIPDLSDKQTSNVWQDFTKAFYDTRSKYDRRSKEYIAQEAEVAGLGRGQTVNLHTLIEEDRQGSVVYLWVKVGDLYLNREQAPEQSREAEQMLLRFGLEAGKEKIRLDIAAQEKALESLMGDLKKLENDKERHERAIEKAQQAIKEAEAGIEKNLEDQKAKNGEIEAQRAMIEATKQKLQDM